MPALTHGPQTSAASDHEGFSLTRVAVVLGGDSGGRKPRQPPGWRRRRPELRQRQREWGQGHRATGRGQLGPTGHGHGRGVKDEHKQSLRGEALHPPQSYVTLKTLRATTLIQRHNKYFTGSNCRHVFLCVSSTLQTLWALWPTLFFLPKLQAQTMFTEVHSVQQGSF